MSFTYWVAYSGGRDSHVLLHSLCQMRAHYPALKLKAIHINHGLHPKAGEWEAHCKAIAQNLNVPFESHQVKLPIESGDSIEAMAREARYGIFQQRLNAESILMTAHNQDDQAETFLLQALRGAGPKGLGGIASERPLGKGWLSRPLLNVSRAEINAYADRYQLAYIDDPSNDETRFRRNFLRHEILPLLQSVYPSATECLSRSSQLCADDNAMLMEYIEKDYQSVLNEKQISSGKGVSSEKQESNEKSKSLHCDYFDELTFQQQCHLLRYWFMKNDLKSPSLQHCKIIIDEVIYAQEDANPSVVLRDVIVKRFKDELILMPRTSGRDLPLSRLRSDPKRERGHLGEGREREAQNHCEHPDWFLNETLNLSNNTVWQAKKVKGKGIACDKLPDASLKVAFREGGERCRLPQKRTRMLKKILQDLAIPPWERDQIPIFYHEDEMVGMGSLFVCDDFAVTDPDEMGWVIEPINF